MTLYHGGARWLDRKGVILPPSRTGAPCGSDFGGAGVHRRDRVYLTSSLDEARMFALLAPPRGGGTVYEAEPIGDTEPDPDYSGPAVCVQVPMARIVRVVDRRVRELGGLGPAEVLAVLGGAA